MKTGRASTVGWLLAILSFALTALLPMTGITRELQLFFAATVFVIVIMAFELLPVLVSAVFVPATFPFVDVKTGDWFYDYVAYVYSNGLMDGTSATTFEPNANMTRAMVWAILARIDGETVTGTAWATDARAWAMAEGVSDGTDPNGLVTREQFATMLYRYAVAQGYDVSIGESTNILSYADFASISEYAIPAMQWVCGSGIITGVTDTTLVPQGTATRAQCAAMLMRFAEL